MGNPSRSSHGDSPSNTIHVASSGCWLQTTPPHFELVHAYLIPPLHTHTNSMHLFIDVRGPGSPGFVFLTSFTRPRSARLSLSRKLNERVSVLGADTQSRHRFYLRSGALYIRRSHARVWGITKALLHRMCWHRRRPPTVAFHHTPSIVSPLN